MLQERGNLQKRGNNSSNNKHTAQPDMHRSYLGGMQCLLVDAMMEITKRSLGNHEDGRDQADNLMSGVDVLALMTGTKFVST